MAKSPANLKPANAKEVLTRGHKKKARTRQALVDAALRIYAQKGVGELALNELAEAASVSNGTVYNYFGTREEVLEAVGIELADQFSDRITSISQGIESGAQRVAVGVRMFIRQAEQDPVWASAVVRVFQYDKRIRSLVAENLRGDLQEGQQQGVFRYANEEIAMGLVLFSTIGAMTAILDGHDADNMDTIVAEMLLMSLGVTPAKANRIAYLSLPESKTVVQEITAKPKKRGRPAQTRSDGDS